MGVGKHPRLKSRELNILKIRKTYHQCIEDFMHVLHLSVFIVASERPRLGRHTSRVLASSSETASLPHPPTTAAQHNLCLAIPGAAVTVAGRFFVSLAAAPPAATEGLSQEHTAPLLCLEEHASMRALAANTRNSGKLRLGVTVLLSAFLPSGWRSDWVLASRYASGRSAGAFYHVKHDPDADLEEESW